MLCLSFVARATTDGWTIDGEHGELHVEGVLAEGACRLDMASDFQQVDLGMVPLGDLQRKGDQGEPVAFHVYLRGCRRTAGSQRNNRSGHLAWSENQPVASMAFIAPNDPDMPNLMKGEGGIGLRLLDAQYKPVKLDSWNRPWFLEPGQDSLTFYVVPVRTAAPLNAGSIRASVDFHLNYD